MTRQVFLSFVAEDLDRVNLFRGQAKARKTDLEFRDYSVKEAFDSNNSDYIRRQIGKLIDRVSVTICLIGSHTHTSQWVDWEVRHSNNFGKGLLGVRLYSDRRSTIPNALLDSPAEIIDWDVRQIVDGIERSARRAGY